MSPALAFPNLGAEEAQPLSHAAERAIAPLAELFRSHVERPTPVFPWLPRKEACVAWLNSPEAERFARARGLPLFGAPPDVVAHCHDKAFARRVAARLGLEAAEFVRHAAVLEVAELEDEGELRARIERSWTEPGSPRAMTLKPRMGTSGRGRVALRGPGDLLALRRGLPRLRAAGGAVLEPWLDRSLDLAVWLWVEPGGGVRIVGSAELLVTRAGAYRGHCGRIDRQGELTSGTPFDRQMRSAAQAVAGAAFEAGYTGPCGVDGFVYRVGEREQLQPILELNARFTLGILVAACLLEQRAWALRGMADQESVAYRCEMSSAPPEPAPGVALRALCPNTHSGVAVAGAPWLAIGPRAEALRSAR